MTRRPSRGAVLAVVGGLLVGIIEAIASVRFDQPGMRELSVLGLVVVVAAEAGSLADAGKLLQAAKDWAAASFVVANALRGAIDPVILKRVAGAATLSHLRAFELEDATREVLTAGQLRGIPKLDRARLAKETSPAQAGRMLRDLTAFRLAVMEAVKPAALWLVEG